jgi:protein O-GlcNAc transferase
MAEISIDQLFETALGHHQAGELPEAEALYRQILQSQSDDADVIQLLGLVHSQSDRKEEAVELLQRAVELNPQAPDAHYNLGMVLADLKRHDEAIGAFRQAVDLKPDFAEAHHHLGLSHRAKGELAAATEAFSAAITAKPDFVEAMNSMAITFRSQRRFKEAIGMYRRALTLRPEVVEIRQNLVNVLHAKGDFADEVIEVREILRLRPDDPRAHYALGNALQSDGKTEEAITVFRHVLEMKPDFAEVYADLGNAFWSRGKLTEAMDAIEQSLALQPELPVAHNNRGNVLQSMGKVDEALAAYDKATSIRPDFADAYYNKGNAYRMMSRFEDAVEAYLQCVDVRPDYFMAYSNMGSTLKEMRRVDEALDSFTKAMMLRPDNESVHSNFLFAMHYLQIIDGRTLYEEHLVWDLNHGQPLRSEILPHPNDRQKDRRLRIGYVSADFREHSVVFFVENLLLHHDRKQVEVFCYSDVTHPDEITARLMKSADHWRESVSWNHAQLAQQIREDRIDILVDLAGHTSGSRLLTFARKPAPIQVTYCGYPNTTGMAAMDYRLTDQWADPSPQADALHTEKLVRLPRSFLCYRPPASAPPIGPLPSLANGLVTFGSFNALAKITAPMMAVWSQILRQVPGSRLLIKSHSGLSDSAPRERLLEIFGSLGIEAERIELIAKIPQMSAHLELYHQVDIALDTYPYHGTATTCEALWMGVPVITLAGQSHVSRVGVSLLNHAGLSDMVASEPQDYVRLAVTLAKDSARLSKLRMGMRDRLNASPLLDGPTFARDLEAAYRTMWHAWVNRPF